MTRKLIGYVACLLLLLAAAPAAAQDEGGQEGTRDIPGALTIELNKLESAEGACRTYFVLSNTTDRDVGNAKLDVFIFDKDDIIERRVALNTEDIPSGKTQVRIFELDGLDCGTIGKFLLNEVLSCEGANGEPLACASFLRLTSRAGAPFVE